MGVSQMPGVQPVSITSPTKANRSVVYLGMPPQIVWRHMHAEGPCSSRTVRAQMLTGV